MDCDRDAGMNGRNSLLSVIIANYSSVVIQCVNDAYLLAFDGLFQWIRLIVCLCNSVMVLESSVY